MRDYRELIDASGLNAETDDGQNGRYARVAVLDSGIPTVNGIISYGTRNFTSGSIQDNTHSTFIGSILFGRSGIHGICAEAAAFFANVFNAGLARPDVVAKAIDCAVSEWRVDVINLSLGFPRTETCPKAIQKACRRAYEAGTVIVAAAGNDGGTALWPAALPEVICVGSTNGLEKAEFSNTGEIDFVVPGVDLEGLSPTGEIITKSGTSFSSALVTGLAALVVSRARSHGIVLKPKEVKDELIALCRDLGRPGWDEETGYGSPFVRAIQKPGIFGRIMVALKRLFRRN